MPGLNQFLFFGCFPRCKLLSVTKSSLPALFGNEMYLLIFGSLTNDSDISFH